MEIAETDLEHEPTGKFQQITGKGKRKLKKEFFLVPHLFPNEICLLNTDLWDKQKEEVFRTHRTGFFIESVSGLTSGYNPSNKPSHSSTVARIDKLFTYWILLDHRCGGSTGLIRSPVSLSNHSD